jgi:hypothetical protein
MCVAEAAKAHIGWGELANPDISARSFDCLRWGSLSLTPTYAPSALGLDKCSGGKTARALHDQTPSSDLLPGGRLKDRAGKLTAHGPSYFGRPPHPAEGRLQAANDPGGASDRPVSGLARDKPDHPASDAPPSRDVRARRFRRHVAAQ